MTGHVCRHCGVVEARASYLALHVGRLHAAAMSPEEADAFTAARAAEDGALVVVRRHVKAGLHVIPVFLFFVFVMILMWEYDRNPAHFIMITPGVLLFSGLVYGMVWSRQALKDKGIVARPDALREGITRRGPDGP
jgi:hypothetical protein